MLFTVLCEPAVQQMLADALAALRGVLPGELQRELPVSGRVQQSCVILISMSCFCADDDDITDYHRSVGCLQPAASVDPCLCGSCRPK